MLANESKHVRYVLFVLFAVHKREITNRGLGVLQGDVGGAVHPEEHSWFFFGVGGGGGNSFHIDDDN